jgi:flagellar basal-body rod protein FlgC
VSLMPAIGVSATGIDAAQTWLDTTAGNIANVDDTAPLGQPVYQQQTPVFTPVAGVTGQGEGVAVSAIALGPAAGQVVEDPSSPQANAKGLVEQPAMSLSTQLVSLVTAQNDFEANATALERAVTAYQSALTLGS